MADGSRHSLFAVEETVSNTTPSSPALDTVRITGTTLGLAKDSLESGEIRSDRQIADFRLGANQVSGDINFELSYGSLDQFLEAVLCSADWATDTPIAGTDQLKAGSERRTFSFIRYFADILDKPYFIYTGCELTSLKLNIAANAMITGSFGVIGRGHTLAADLSGLGTPTYNAVSTTSSLDSFTGTLNEGGSPIAVITEVNFTLENGIAPRFVVGSADGISPSIGRSNLKGNISAFFENVTLIEKFINGTESEMDLTLPDAAGNEQKIIVPRIVYTGGQPDVEGEGPVLVNMPFQAILDSTESTNFVLERTPV